MVAREALVARQAGASPVMAREAGASRVALVVPRAAPVVLMRPCSSSGVVAALVASTARGSGGSGGVDVGKRRRRSGATENWGDGGEVGRGIWGRSGGWGAFLGYVKLSSNAFCETRYS